MGPANNVADLLILKIDYSLTSTLPDYTVKLGSEIKNETTRFFMGLFCSAVIWAKSRANFFCKGRPVCLPRATTQGCPHLFVASYVDLLCEFGLVLL